MNIPWRGVSLFVVLLAIPACAAPQHPTGHPYLAEAAAVFPGCVYLGAGHRVAGAPETADELGALQAYSLVLAGSGYLSQRAGEGSDAGRIGGGCLLSAGALVHLAAWIYDLAYSPAAARGEAPPRARSPYGSPWQRLPGTGTDPVPRGTYPGMSGT